MLTITILSKLGHLSQWRNMKVYGVCYMEVNSSKRYVCPGYEKTKSTLRDIRGGQTVDGGSQSGTAISREVEYQGQTETS